MEVYIGIGFHDKVNSSEIEAAVTLCLREFKIEPKFLKGLCTVDFKVNEELKKAAENLKVPIFTFSSEEINEVSDEVSEMLSKSAAFEVLKLKGVAEPSAILAAKKNKRRFELIAKKVYTSNITLSVVKCYT
jgi:cobalamin biosynthesis protein CbiG